MKTKEKNLELQNFFPADIEIKSIEESSSRIILNMWSKKHECICHKCGVEAINYHSTYKRTVQDLPILGKNVVLKIRAYEYWCENPECEQKIVAEDYNGFIGRYDRMTERCVALIKTIAYETSCEGAAYICSHMGIKISGYTIIRVLIKDADNNPAEKCGEDIGVDDFAYKKGQTYCTIVCDKKTSTPVAVLEGRDGNELKEWLKKNKQVKRVTRDRASAYAKAISDILPDAMQVADRFHLHQNLLDAVKDTLKKEIPTKIPIQPSDTQDDLPEQSAKKVDEKRG